MLVIGYVLIVFLIIFVIICVEMIFIFLCLYYIEENKEIFLFLRKIYNIFNCVICKKRFGLVRVYLFYIDLK